MVVNSLTTGQNISAAGEPLGVGVRWRRRLMRWLLLFIAVYVGFALLVMCLQRKLIYVPTRFGAALAAELAGRDGFQAWLNHEGQVVGWRLPAVGQATGAVLIAHGNAGSALDRGYLAKPIHEAAGVDVFILEYPGYGARAGAPSQDALLKAGDEAFELLPSKLPVYLVSESLGTGIVAHLAKVHGARVAGLLCFVPYDRFTSVGQRHMPWLPVSLMLWDRFKPVEWLRDYRGPAWFVVAGKDEVIPPDLGRNLHDHYAGPKRLEVVPGGHNDAAAQTAEWWRQVFRFWVSKGDG